MADPFRISFFAIQLVPLVDRADFEGAFSLLEEFTPQERIEIGEKAIFFGADPVNTALMINTINGEVVEVMGKAPSLTLPSIALAILGGLAGGAVAKYIRGRM